MEAQVIIKASRSGYSVGQIENTLTVQELIEILSACDPDSKVYLSHDNGYTYGGISYGGIEEQGGEEE